MVPATIATFLVALCLSTHVNGVSTQCEVDSAHCTTVPAAAPSQSEPGSSLFQHGTGRSFVVTAHASNSKPQLSEPTSSLLLGDSDVVEEDEDGLVPRKRAAPSASSDDPAFYLGVCLDILVFLIIMDGVRRYCGTKETARHSSAPSESQPHVGLSRALMTQQPRLTGSQIAKDAAERAPKLHAAVRAGDMAQCRAILDDAGSLLTRRVLVESDLWGCTALHLAADTGSSETVSMLLDRGAQVNAVDAWDQTPLHFAARARSTAVCRILLNCGATVDAVDAQEHTALHVAGKLGDEATCELLLDRGGGLSSTTDADIPPMLSALLVKRMFQPSKPTSPTN